jgi:cyclopropane fatty-acyl-phospholipid synthase-like methyltransferase
VDPKRVVAEGYDRLGPAYSAWDAENSPEVRSWFLGEVLARLSEGSDVLELGCGSGPAAAVLSAGRRYVGVDLSRVQLSIARRRVPHATFVRGDFTSMDFRSASFDGVVAFYVFMHVPREELAPTFERAFGWLRPGGRLMLTLSAGDNEDVIEPDWLGVPMFFAGFTPETNERLLRETGFHLEISEVREEVEARYGLARFHWVIARKPGG